MDRNPCTLTALLDRWVCERGEQIALYFQDRKLTFRDLQQRSRTAAGVLSQLGIGPGSRVAFLDRNHISFFELMFGALYLGATLLPLNFRLAPTELLYVLTDSDAELLFVSADYLPIVLSLRAHIPRLQRVIVIDESEGSEYSQLFVDAPRLSPVSLHHAELDDVAVQMYTSGTTGQPKGALLTHRGLWAVVEQGLGWCPWQSGDVGMAPMPLFHIGGCGWSLVMLHAGLSVVLLRDPDPLSLMRAVQRFRVTQMFVVPVLLSAMVNHPQRADFDLRSLRHLFYGASPISAEVLASALANLSCGFVQVYGLTEATGTLTFLSAEDHLADRDRLRSCGRPGKDVTIRVIDAAGRDVPIGTVGEIIAKSPQVMAGYYNQPEATSLAIRDGWLYTGDAGYLDGDGYLYICDRVKDMIISGGENIYPAEVESVLSAHPAIADLAVIGIPDPQWGESVVACIVCKPGAHLELAELIQWARPRLAGYKIPRRIEMRTSLPRNASGKVLRRELRAPYWEDEKRQVS